MWRDLILSAFLLSVAIPALASEEPEWYLPVADGCQLFIKEIGIDGDPVIVIHGGFGAEHGYMLDGLQPLAGQFHFVLYDQRGSLRSPCRLEAITAAGHVEDLERLRQAISVPKISIVAHSQGTWIAMAYLSAHPDRVKHLALMGPVAPRKALADPEAKRLRKLSNDRRDEFLKRPEIEAMLHREGVDKPSGQLTAKQISIAARIRFAGANVYHVENWRLVRGGGIFWNDRSGNAASKTMPDQYDYIPALVANPCSVSVILGDHDLVDFGGDQWRNWISNIPGGELKLIPNAGHVAWVDAPEAVNNALSHALKRTCTN